MEPLDDLMEQIFLLSAETEFSDSELYRVETSSDFRRTNCSLKNDHFCDCPDWTTIPLDLGRLEKAGYGCD
jgi:hypothetical protein